MKRMMVIFVLLAFVAPVCAGERGETIPPFPFEVCPAPDNPINDIDNVRVAGCAAMHAVVRVWLGTLTRVQQSVVSGAFGAQPSLGVTTHPSQTDAPRTAPAPRGART